MNIFNPDQLGSILESGKGRVGGGFSSAFDGASSAQNAAKGPAESRFEQALKDTISRVNETQNSADASVQRMASGLEPNVHNTMLQLEQAEISLKLAMQVRSKALEAYQEIMRMQV